jgi:hypothetical protein
LSWNSVLSGKLVIIFMLAMLIFIHAGWLKLVADYTANKSSLDFARIHQIEMINR